MDFVADYRPSETPGASSLALETVLAAPQAASKRGPMRPNALAPTRRRVSGAAIARRFRRLDVGALICAWLAAFWSLSHGDLLATPLRLVLPTAIGAVALVWALKAAAVYAFAPRETLWAHLGKTIGAICFGCSAAVATIPVFGVDATLCVRWSFVSLAVLTASHALQWLSVRRWRDLGLLTPNVVVVGATPNAARLIEAALKARDSSILGVFDDRMSRIPGNIHGVPVLGDTNALLNYKLLPFIDHIVITVTPSAQNRVRELIDRLKFLPNAVTLFMDVEGIAAERAALSRLADAPLAQVSGTHVDDAKADAKRLQDIVLGLFALVLAAPIMTLIALAVRLESPGPIFFRQRRHGFNNETILVWKFRSMRHETADATATRQVSVGDDRVTRVGRIIRRLSLDELPQLFNVLKGEMSLVGPRPHAIGMKTAGEDSSRLVAEYAWRHRMKPGLTGWAQINGSIGAVDTPELVRRRVSLDVEYIERQSFWFDLHILLMTVPALIGARNAVR